MQMKAAPSDPSLNATTGNHGQPRATTGDHGQPRTTTDNHGQPRATTDNHGQPRTTTEVAAPSVRQVCIVTRKKMKPTISPRRGDRAGGGGLPPCLFPRNAPKSERNPVRPQKEFASFRGNSPISEGIRRFPEGKRGGARAITTDNSLSKSILHSAISGNRRCWAKNDTSGLSRPWNFMRLPRTHSPPPPVISLRAILFTFRVPFSPRPLFRRHARRSSPRGRSIYNPPHDHFSHGVQFRICP